MRIESGAQLAMEMAHAAEAQAGEVALDIASGNLDAAPDMKPAEIEAAVSVEIFGKVMDVHETIAMELINMIQAIDVSI